LPKLTSLLEITDWLPFHQFLEQTTYLPAKFQDKNLFTGYKNMISQFLTSVVEINEDTHVVKHAYMLLRKESSQRKYIAADPLQIETEDLYHDLYDAAVDLVEVRSMKLTYFTNRLTSICELFRVSSIGAHLTGLKPIWCKMRLADALFTEEAKKALRALIPMPMPSEAYSDEDKDYRLSSNLHSSASGLAMALGPGELNENETNNSAAIRAIRNLHNMYLEEYIGELNYLKDNVHKPRNLSLHSISSPSLLEDSPSNKYVAVASADPFVSTSVIKRLIQAKVDAYNSVHATFLSMPDKDADDLKLSVEVYRGVIRNPHLVTTSTGYNGLFTNLSKDMENLVRGRQLNEEELQALLDSHTSDFIRGLHQDQAVAEKLLRIERERSKSYAVDADDLKPAAFFDNISEKDEGTTLDGFKAILSQMPINRAIQSYNTVEAVLDEAAATDSKHEFTYKTATRRKYQLRTALLIDLLIRGKAEDATTIKEFFLASPTIVQKDVSSLALVGGLVSYLEFSDGEFDVVDIRKHLPSAIKPELKKALNITFLDALLHTAASEEELAVAKELELYLRITLSSEDRHMSGTRKFFIRQLLIHPSIREKDVEVLGNMTTETHGGRGVVPLYEAMQNEFSRSPKAPLPYRQKAWSELFGLPLPEPRVVVGAFNRLYGRPRRSHYGSLSRSLRVRATFKVSHGHHN